MAPKRNKPNKLDKRTVKAPDMPQRRSKALPALAAAALLAVLPALQQDAHAANCGLFNTVATDIAAWDMVNGPVVVDHRPGGCAATAQGAVDGFTVVGASISSSTSADFGLLSAHAVVAAAATPTHGVLAFYASYLGDGYVARTFDTLTALADTQLRFTAVFDFAGSFSGTATATSQASAQLFVTAPGSNSFTSNVTGAAGGSAHQVFTRDITLLAGQTVNLRSSLYADADGSANAAGASGLATLDATYALGLQVLNAGGRISAASGHDYLTAAVPEPSRWALFAAGLAVMGCVARRRTV